MIRYKTRVLANMDGVPIVDLTQWAAGAGVLLHADQIGPVHEVEAVLEPRAFITVWNCDASLCFVFIQGTQELEFYWPRRIPRRVWDAMLADIEDQGGAITWSGRYEILSEVIREFIESERVQRWLRRVAEKNGFEVVEEDQEQASGDG